MTLPHDDIVAVGGAPTPDVLLRAYRQGIFPWPAKGLPLLWFCPLERAILDFADLHVPARLRRTRRRTTLHFTIDAAFGEVIRACAATPRPNQDGTWITSEMIQGYATLHRRGHAHSVEAWRDDRLVGGVYGVDADGAFSAESMFYRESDASKLALLHLIDHLAARGLDWIDVQMLTPHVERLGARTLPRNLFLARLAATRARGLRLFT